jgi:hypothetical protein
MADEEEMVTITVSKAAFEKSVMCGILMDAMIKMGVENWERFPHAVNLANNYRASS